MAKKIRGRKEGSVSQRANGTWRAQIVTGGQRVSKGFRTKSEALEWLRNTQVEIERGFDYHAGKTNLRDYMLRWLENDRSTLRAKTADQYRRTVDKHILPNLGDMQMMDIRLIRVEQFYSDLIQSGAGIRTVRIIHAILHKAFEKAVRYGFVVRNPVHGAALPRYKSGEMMVLDESQVTQFLVAAQSSPYLALYHLAVTTGMRLGELFGLKWSDLQWMSGTLLVQRQLQRVPRHGWSFVEPKTRSGRRAIKLGENTLQALRIHKSHQEMVKALAGSRWKDHDLIFPTSIGTPGDASNMRIDFRRVLQRAGLPRIRFHDLRHTAASLMLNHGVPAIVVSKILGHSKPSITLDVYGHLYHEMQGSAAVIMDQLVAPIQMEALRIGQDADRA